MHHFIALALVPIFSAVAFSQVYPIPGNTATIHIESSTPGYDPTPAEISRMLAILSKYPAEHLAAIRYIRVQPRSGSTALSYGNGAIEYYVRSVGERAGEPFFFETTLPTALRYNIYTALPATAKADLQRISGPIAQQNFDLAYSGWTISTTEVIESSLKSAVEALHETSLFMLGLFTDFTTRTVAKYSNNVRTTAPIEIHSDRIVFGKFTYFVSGSQWTGFQNGTSAPVIFTTPKPLPSFFQGISFDNVPRFTRGDVSIALREEAAANARWTDAERVRLNFILNALPLAHLRGLLTIATSAALPDEPSFSLTDTTIDFNLRPVAERTSAYARLESGVARAVGLHRYRSLTDQEKTEFRAYQSALNGFTDVLDYSFAARYSDWVRRTPFGIAIQHASLGIRTDYLELDLWTAADYVDASSQTIQMFSLDNGGVLQTSTPRIVYTDTLLTLGTYDFQLSSGRVTAIRNRARPETSEWVPLAAPVNLPRRLLAKLVKSTNTNTANSASKSTPAAASSQTVAEGEASLIATPVSQETDATSVMVVSPDEAPTRVYIPLQSDVAQERLQRTLERGRRGVQGARELVSPSVDSPHPVVEIP
jgi:hypothetical protein